MTTQQLSTYYGIAPGKAARLLKYSNSVLAAVMLCLRIHTTMKRRQDKQRTLRHDQIKRGNGLLPFSTSGGEIWALNKKSAQRKCDKKGWVLY